MVSAHPQEAIMIGTWQAVVFDCKDPDALASFYQELLGMIRVQADDDGGWVGIGDAPDRPAVAFQRVEGYVPPDWPGQELPQQAHLDVRVKDLDIAETEVLALGATATGSGGASFRVYLDPQGHPFCLVSW
ncbi:VOC family protein [Galactobacter valiniphilus]|uniref:VOC family protein n=1 Tax=Galactobacter valiniphilus TaxID=2676122 RepID=UPI0037361507